MTAVALAALLVTGTADAAELGINVFGLSYHPDRARAKASGYTNEFNPGLGLRYEITPRKSEHVLMIEADVYRDSKRATAKAAGAAYQYRVSEHLRTGVALVVFHSNTYNDGKVFITPLPVVTVEMGPVALNATYSPRISGVNDVAGFGFYLTIPLRQSR
jgi:hypothetical protein